MTNSQTTISIPPIIKATIQDLPPARLYYKTDEVAKITGLTAVRIQFIAEYLDIPKFVSGNYKFKEKHIEKIVQTDKVLKEREDKKILNDEELAAKRKRELASRKRDILNQKKESARKARLRTQEIDRIQRRMNALSVYMSEQLRMLQDQMAVVART